MRLRGCAKTTAVPYAPRARTTSFGGQLQVDVLERRAQHLEPFELLAACQRLVGELVQAAGRILRALDDQLAVPAVADLGLDGAARQVGRLALAHDHAVAQHRDTVGEL